MRHGTALVLVTSFAAACDGARVPSNQGLTPALLAPPQSKGDVAGQRADIAAFDRDFLKADRSYSPESRAEAVKQLEDLRRNAGSISDTLFVLRLSQIAALADNGHTGVMYRGKDPEERQVGLSLGSFVADFAVVSAEAAHADLLGARLAAIDGTPIERLRQVARTLAGGVSSRRDQMAPGLFESLDQLNALGLAGSARHATYRFVSRDGTIREEALTATGRGGRGGGCSFLEPDSAPDGWKTLLASDKAPWALREPDETMRTRDRPDLQALVIQLRVNMDAGRSIEAFLDEAEAARRRIGRPNVILDMRMNGGGNLQLTRKWMSELPRQLPPEGRVVVLTSPCTFSAAISSTAYLKQAGGARVVLVGEAPGDRLRFWAEGQPLSLPYSGAMVLMATQRHDYITGCKGYDDCHHYVAAHPLALSSLEPDIPAPWTLDAYAAGRDPGMEAAARVLSRSR